MLVFDTPPKVRPRSMIRNAGCIIAIALLISWETIFARGKRKVAPNSFQTRKTPAHIHVVRAADQQMPNKIKAIWKMFDDSGIIVTLYKTI
jgi:hypothetical protein